MRYLFIKLLLDASECYDLHKISCNHCNLKEIIDADGSGTLQITELVQGLLKIRGDISKSSSTHIDVSRVCICYVMQYRCILYNIYH